MSRPRGARVKVIEVAAGLVFRGGRLLITQRPAQGHLGGLWEFPGGKRDPGETWVECLVRELREELDIEIDPGPRFESVLHHYPERSVQIEFFLCRLRSSEPRPIGCADLAWITREEVGNYRFPEADARLLDRLRTEAELWTDPEARNVR